jgi:hypothetical protein
MTTTPHLASEIAHARIDQLRRDVRRPRRPFAWLLGLI